MCVCVYYFYNLNVFSRTRIIYEKHIYTHKWMRACGFLYSYFNYVIVFSNKDSLSLYFLIMHALFVEQQSAPPQAPVCVLLVCSLHSIYNRQWNRRILLYLQCIVSVYTYRLIMRWRMFWCWEFISNWNTTIHCVYSSHYF